MWWSGIPDAVEAMHVKATQALAGREIGTRSRQEEAGTIAIAIAIAIARPGPTSVDKRAD